MLDFNEAVSIAREQWEKAQWLLKANAPFGCQFSLVFFDGTDREEWLSDLIAASSDTPAVYDGLRNISAALVLYEKPLPPALRTWLADHLTGKVTRPARRGRSGYENLFRDHITGKTVKLLTGRGLPQSEVYRAVGLAMHKSDDAVRSIADKSL